MKYFLFFLVLVGFVGFAFGSENPKPLELDNFASELWYEHDYIIDGTILDIRGYGTEERIYDIQINSFFKPKQSPDHRAITVFGSPNFYNIEGDRGIFFIKKEDARWKFGEYGSKATPECSPELMYHPPKLIDPPLYRGLHGADFTYVDCAPHYYREYLPEYMQAHGAPVFSPLTQQIDGVSPSKVVCNKNLILIQKHDGFSACVKESTKQKLLERGWAHDDSLTLDWKKHITVSASNIDKSYLKNIDHVVTPEDMQNVLLQTLLYGADGCKNETEICKISGGISVSRTYPFLTSYISGNDMYSITLTITDAEDLLSSFDWKKNENMLYSGIQLDEKYYILILSTFENSKTPDVKMNLFGTTYEPILLERGKLLNYTIQVNTWATYGAPAQIDLRAVQGTKDSGIDVWVDPPTITVPERSNATSTLFIKAQDDANDGLYDVRVIGRANGNLADLYCRNTVCPTVNVGNSSWSIATFGSDSNMGIGGVESLKDTFLELDLNKKEFFEGDIVEIKTYLVNNSTEKISFVPDGLLIKVIKAQDVGYYDNLYGIDARYESDEPLVLEPHSKTLLVRPFYWNQNTFEGFDDEQRVDARQHKMIAKFVGEAYAWSDDIWFGVK